MEEYLQNTVRENITSAFDLCMDTGTNSNETQMKVNQGLKIVTNLYNSNKEYQECLGEVNELLQNTKQSHDRINSIVETINAISRQTKLLSFNASIESARVGEAGRGFGIVAKEIKKLSEGSAESIKSITETINDLSEKLTLITGKIDELNTKFYIQLSEVEKTEATFRDIMQAVNNIGADIEKVSSVIAGIDNYINNLDVIK